MTLLSNTSSAQQKSSKAVKKGAELEDDEKPIPNTGKVQISTSQVMSTKCHLFS